MSAQRLAPAGPESAALLAALHARLFDDPWSEAAFKSLLAAPGGGAILAVMKDQPAGFILYRAIAGEGEVLTFGVDPGFRRAGLGRALLAGMEAAALERGAHRLFLEVSETNTVAIALYEKAGWSTCGRRARYYPDGSDARLLEKRLAKPGPARSD